jgi:chromosome segregation ATPase
MPRESLTDRVERLESAVEGLQTLPAAVAALGERVGSLEAEISQLRTEMRAEFATRAETHERFAAARDDLLVGLADVGRQIQEAAEESKRHSRTLFEEALSRIAILAEHVQESSERKPRPPRRKR